VKNSLYTEYFLFTPAGIGQFYRNGRQAEDGDGAWKIAEGRGALPSWKERLADEHIWDLVNFIQSLAEKAGGEGRQQ